MRCHDADDGAKVSNKSADLLHENSKTQREALILHDICYQLVDAASFCLLSYFLIRNFSFAAKHESKASSRSPQFFLVYVACCVLWIAIVDPIWHSQSCCIVARIDGLSALLANAFVGGNQGWAWGCGL
jgi:hypothetical protein